MTGIQLFSALSGAIFALTSGAMGIRLVWLSSRSRQLPELFIGSGFVLLVLIALPCVAASGMGRTSVGEIRFGFLAAGMIFLWLGVTSLFAFTWRSFRPQATWAGLVTLMASVAIAVIGVGVFGTLYTAPAEADAFSVARGWTALIRVPVLLFYVWTGAESLRQYTMARRRLSLGLGDPVVANRFLLWSLVGVSQAAVYVVNLVMHAYDMGAMNNPASMLLIALGGATGSVLMYFTFLPPAVYLRFVRGRAALQGA